MLTLSNHTLSRIRSQYDKHTGEREREIYIYRPTLYKLMFCSETRQWVLLLLLLLILTSVQHDTCACLRYLTTRFAGSDDSTTSTPEKDIQTDVLFRKPSSTDTDPSQRHSPGQRSQETRTSRRFVRRADGPLLMQCVARGGVCTEGKQPLKRKPRDDFQSSCRTDSNVLLFLAGRLSRISNLCSVCVSVCVCVCLCVYVCV